MACCSKRVMPAHIGAGARRYLAPHCSSRSLRAARVSHYDSLRAMKPQRFGRYEVVRHLATGGMAEVYLARARGGLGTERLVVVKVALPRQSYVDMFLDEARLAASLQHANVVQVIEVGEDDGKH